MRVALIAIGETAGETAEAGKLAGRSLARHQLDFALALRCEKVILFGHGASPEAIGLRHEAEAGSAQVQVIHRVRDLPAAVRGDDQLLVLAQGLLPDSPLAFDLLKESQGILVLPAEAGWSAGFERLDLGAAWGGAMVVPGRIAAGLDQLPDDAEPIAGLLRLARQGGVPERPLPVSELAEGRWQIVRTPEAVHAIEPAWLQRRLPAGSPFRPTNWLARFLMRRFGSPWIGDGRLLAGLAASTVLLLAGAVVAAWFDLPALAFTALIPGALIIEAGDAFKRLARSVFIAETKNSRLFLVLRLMWDAVFVVLGVLAIDGSRAHRLFAPLVATGLLHTPPRWPQTGWRALAVDRGLLAVLLAISATFGFVEGTLMIYSLLLIVLRIAGGRDERS